MSDEREKLRILRSALTDLAADLASARRRGEFAEHGVLGAKDALARETSRQTAAERLHSAQRERWREMVEAAEGARRRINGDAGAGNGTEVGGRFEQAPGEEASGPPDAAEAESLAGRVMSVVIAPRDALPPLPSSAAQPAAMRMARFMRRSRRRLRREAASTAAATRVAAPSFEAAVASTAAGAEGRVPQVEVTDAEKKATGAPRRQARRGAAQRTQSAAHTTPRRQGHRPTRALNQSTAAGAGDAVPLAQQLREVAGRAGTQRPLQPLGSTQHTAPRPGLGPFRSTGHNEAREATDTAGSDAGSDPDARGSDSSDTDSDDDGGSDDEWPPRPASPLACARLGRFGDGYTLDGRWLAEVTTRLRGSEAAQEEEAVRAFAPAAAGAPLSPARVGDRSGIGADDAGPSPLPAGFRAHAHGPVFGNGMQRTESASGGWRRSLRHSLGASKRALSQAVGGGLLARTASAATMQRGGGADAGGEGFTPLGNVFQQEQEELLASRPAVVAG